MEESRKQLRSRMLLIAFGIVLFVGLWNLGTVFTTIGTVLQMMSFFIIGLSLAFLLNPLLSAIEDRLFSPLNKRLGSLWKSIRHPLGVFLTLLLALCLIALMLVIVIPEMVRTVNVLSGKLPAFISDLEVWYQGLQVEQQPSALLTWIGQLDLEGMIASASTWIRDNSQTILTGTLSYAGSFSANFVSFILGLVLSVYILISKNQLSRQVKRVLYAFAKPNHADRICDVAGKAYRSFTQFFRGQFLEALCLGLLMFIGMTIFKFPFALVVAILVGVLAFIPYFGAFVAVTLGAFMMLVHQGALQALYFILFFFILQQLDGIFIYPRIVGKSTKLPAMWVLTSVTLGAKLGGIIGMLVSVPFCSLLYTLLREAVVKREKNLDVL